MSVAALPETEDAPSARPESGPLPLNSLEIKNFRAFRHLTIEKLGRVNLITGRNSVGKSTLLESLYLYANRGSVRSLRHILTQREDFTASSTLSEIKARTIRSGVSVDVSLLSGVFHNRPQLDHGIHFVQVGTVENSASLLTMAVFRQPKHSPESDKLNTFSDVLANFDPKTGKYTNGLEEGDLYIYTTEYGTGDALTYSGTVIESLFEDNRYVRYEDESTPLTCIWIPADGLTSFHIGAYWDKVALTDSEEDIVTALRIIEPKLHRVSLVGGNVSGADGRVAVARVESINRPIPLKNLGDGFLRLFEIALTMANSANGILLLDEVENGLHYSVLPYVWRLIFSTAQRLNIQVFATTHSWDCIEAFQRAAAESPEEGCLIKLRKISSGIDAVVFDEEELEVVTRQQIEVR